MENAIASGPVLDRGPRALVWTGRVLTTPDWFPVAFGVSVWVAYALRSRPLRAFLLSAVR
jgi:hypothetical protein